MDKLVRLADSIPDRVYFIDRGRLIYRTNRHIPQAEQTEVAGTRVDEWVALKHRRQAITAIERCFRTGEDTSYESTSTSPEGASVHYVNHVVRSESGDEPSAMVWVRDVSAQVSATRKVRASGQRLRRAMSLGCIGLWRCDRVAQTFECDEWLRATFSLARRAPNKHSWLARLHPDDLECVETMTTSWLDQESPPQCSEIDYRLRHADGSYRWVVDRMMRPDASGVVIGLALDVSELQREPPTMRERESSKQLETISRLADALEHDVNNSLMIIQTSIDMVLRRANKGGDLATPLRRIEAATRRLEHMTSRLLDPERHVVPDAAIFGIREHADPIRLPLEAKAKADDTNREGPSSA